MQKQPSSVQLALARGTFCNAMASALMMKSLTDSLKERGPSCGAMPLRRVRAASTASRSQSMPEIEMRDGLLGEREPLGNHAAHGVVRHNLVAAGLVERQHLLVGQTRGRRRPRQREAPLRLGHRLDGFDRFCLLGDDESPRQRPEGCRA